MMVKYAKLPTVFDPNRQYYIHVPDASVLEFLSHLLIYDNNLAGIFGLITY